MNPQEHPLLQVDGRGALKLSVPQKIRSYSWTYLKYQAANYVNVKALYPLLLYVSIKFRLYHHLLEMLCFRGNFIRSGLLFLVVEPYFHSWKSWLRVALSKDLGFLAINTVITLMSPLGGTTLYPIWKTSLSKRIDQEYRSRSSNRCWIGYENPRTHSQHKILNFVDHIFIILIRV